MARYQLRRYEAPKDLAIYALVLACTGVLFWAIWTAGFAVLADRPRIDTAAAWTGIASGFLAILVMRVAAAFMSYDGD